MNNLVKTEPALVISTLSGLATAVIAAIIAFGGNLTEAQSNAILGMIAPTVGVIILAGAIVRQFVRPVATSVSTDTAKKVARDSADVGQADPLNEL
jgi:outer membrane murein-binding lipoprotein Lpp